MPEVICGLVMASGILAIGAIAKKCELHWPVLLLAAAEILRCFS